MLQFISHQTPRFTYLDSIALALEGGCRGIQLRMKEATAEERRTVALQAQRMCQEMPAIFIIDDDVERARAIHAEGVHLGKADMPRREARRLLGADAIIGGTANTIADVLDHWQAGADYVGCGPFRFTTTKKALSPILGLEGYRGIVAQMQHLPPRANGRSTLPMVAIGGITAADIPDILATGIGGIALSGAVLQADKPVEEMRRVLEIMKNSTTNHAER